MFHEIWIVFSFNIFFVFKQGRWCIFVLRALELKLIRYAMQDFENIKDNISGYNFLSKLNIYNHKLSINMAKTKTLVVRITPNQEKIMQDQTKDLGFQKISDYVRFSLFYNNQKVN